MESPVYFRRWRWAALILVVVNAVYGYLLQRLHPTLPSIAEISARHENLFTPAGYAFAIWGLIYAGFTYFCIYILLPAQRMQPAYNSLARGLVLYALLGMVWEESFIREHVGLSVFIIGFMFAIGAVMFGLAKQCLRNGLARAPLFATFSLFFGWISVATLANLAGWLKSIGWQGGVWGEVPWTVAMISGAVVLGIVISRQWRDSVYPLAIIWSLIAIWVRQRHTSGLVEYTALGGAMILTLWTLINAGWVRSHALLRQTVPPQGNPPATI